MSRQLTVTLQQFNQERIVYKPTAALKVFSPITEPPCCTCQILCQCTEANTQQCDKLTEWLLN